MVLQEQESEMRSWTEERPTSGERRGWRATARFQKQNSVLQTPGRQLFSDLRKEKKTSFEMYCAF